MTRDCSLNYKKNTSSEHVVHKYCFECQNRNKNFVCSELVFFFYCGLTDARMRASEKDLPVVNAFRLALHLAKKS